MLSLDGLTMSLYKVQISKTGQNPRKSRNPIFLSFPIFYHCSFTVFWNHHSTHMSNPQVSLALSLMSAILPLKQLKGFTSSSGPCPLDPGHSNYSQMMPLTTHSPLSLNHDSKWWIAPNCTPSQTFLGSGTQLQCPWQRATQQFFEASTMATLPWRLWLLIDVVTNHQNLQYFSTAKILMHHQSVWSEYAFWIQLIIHFHPRKLGTKPTRQWDIYLKEGNSDYAASIHRTTAWYSFRANWHHPFELLPYQSQSSMDLSSWMLKGSILNIQSQLWEDPISAEHLNIQSEPMDPGPWWSTTGTPDALCFWIPEPFILCFSSITQPFLAGNFSQTKHSIKSTCTTTDLDSFLCQRLLQVMYHLFHAKPVCHKLNDFSNNFWFPRALEIPYHGFHRELPPSSSYPSILVIVDHRSKQSLFIPTHDHHSPQLAQLFISTSFQSMVVPSHITSDSGNGICIPLLPVPQNCIGHEVTLHFQISPEGDGPTKWTNQTLEQYLLLKSETENWNRDSSLEKSSNIRVS